MSQLSLIQIFALNAMATCIELVYAVEGAYFVPAIYDSGVSQIYGSMLICISPLMGTVFQSYLQLVTSVSVHGEDEDHLY